MSRVVGLGLDIQPSGAPALATLLGLPGAIFTEYECGYASRRRQPLESAAGIFAAKEALFKALPPIPGACWTDYEVVHDERGAPAFTVAGAVSEAFAANRWHAHLSISHAAGLSSAVVVIVEDA
jgi:holo-[acyl-carrier protein] synthase